MVFDEYYMFTEYDDLNVLNKVTFFIKKQGITFERSQIFLPYFTVINLIHIYS